MLLLMGSIMANHRLPTQQAARYVQILKWFNTSMESFLLVRQQPHIHTVLLYVSHTPSENPPEPKSLRPVDGTEEQSTLRHNAPTTEHKRKKTTYETGICDTKHCDIYLTYLALCFFTIPMYIHEQIL